MRRFLAQKVAFLFSVLAGLVVFVFLLFVTLPSPEQIMIGQRSDKATTQAIVKDLGLDQPKWRQFLWYINDLSPLSAYENDSKKPEIIGAVKLFETKNLGFFLKWPYLRTSFQNKQPVINIIKSSFIGTAVLALTAMILALLIGIPLGVWASVNKGNWLDNLIVSVSALGISIPSFFSAMIFAWIFGILLKDYTGLSITGSLVEIDPMGNGKTIAWRNLVLPAISLGIRPLAVFIQLSRNTMVDVLDQDFIRTAKAKGLKNWQIIWKHAFPNAINPLVTSVGGWLSSLLAGAFFTEYIFNWKGLGKVTIEALQQSDLPVIMGTVLFTACMFFFINLFTEMLYFWLDPRLRYE
jgi:peptide/nickel transport system permease protein